MRGRAGLVPGKSKSAMKGIQSNKLNDLVTSVLSRVKESDLELAKGRAKPTDLAVLCTHDAYSGGMAATENHPECICFQT